MGQGGLRADGGGQYACAIADRHAADLQRNAKGCSVGQLGLADFREDGVIGLGHG
ncbi:hypothetical protein D3C84_1245100 [compost metagenome]